MTEKGWKKFERRMAVRRVGGRRTGILGGEDVESRRFSIETKLLARLPAWMEAVYAQALRNAPAGKIPVAIIKEKGRRDTNALVVLAFGDFDRLASLYESAKEE